MHTGVRHDQSTFLIAVLSAVRQLLYKAINLANCLCRASDNNFASMRHTACKLMHPTSLELPALSLSQGVGCAGQVALSSQEAEALKESRQSSATKDWLMDTEPPIELDVTGSSLHQTWHLFMIRTCVQHVIPNVEDVCCVSVPMCRLSLNLSTQDST